MREWKGACGALMLLVGACHPSDGEDVSEDEPGDYACLMCADFEETSRSAEDWADEAECSEHVVSVNPVADCFDGEGGEAVQIAFKECRRKPACVETAE